MYVSPKAQKQLDIAERVRKLNRMYREDLKLILDDQDMISSTVIGLLGEIAYHVQDLGTIQLTLVTEYLKNFPELLKKLDAVVIEDTK